MRYMTDINSTFRIVENGFRATHRQGDRIVLRNFKIDSKPDSPVPPEMRVETRYLRAIGNSDIEGDLVGQKDAVYPIENGTVNGSELPPKVWAEQVHWEDPEGDFEEWATEVFHESEMES